MSEKGPHVAGCGLAVGETDQEERERERTQGWRGERGARGEEESMPSPSEIRQIYPCRVAGDSD